MVANPFGGPLVEVARPMERGAPSTLFPTHAREILLDPRSRGVEIPAMFYISREEGAPGNGTLDGKDLIQVGPGFLRKGN